MPLFLHIEKGPQAGSRIECNPSSITTIGRSRSNTLQIKDAGISQKHLYFRWTDPEWTVTDGGSSNGTAINEVKIQAEKGVVLKSGDVIKIGEATTIKVEIPVPAFAVDNPEAATSAKASSKSKEGPRNKRLSARKQDDQEPESVTCKPVKEEGELQLDYMTVGQWFDHMMEQTPRYLFEVSETLIQDMTLQAEQFDKYICSLKQSQENE